MPLGWLREEMARIFALTNQKGGVGKTTTAINLAACLAAARRRVLLVDLDPQGNATIGSGIEKNSLEHSMYHLLLEDMPAGALMQRSESGGYDVLPADGDLTAAEAQLPGKEYCLRERLAPLGNDYDYILIDSPPALNPLTVNAMMAADGLIVPVQCEYYALEGLSALVQTVERLQERHPPLHIAGVLRTMYDSRNSLAQEVSEQLRVHFGDRLYHTIIPRNVRLAEAPSHGMPALAYDQLCRGAQAYQELAGEVLGRANSSPGSAG